MSKWSLGVKISSFAVSMAMITAAYEYTDELMAWVFEMMNSVISSQIDQLLQGVM